MNSVSGSWFQSLQGEGSFRSRPYQSLGRLTNVFPTEASSSPRTIRVEIAISEVALLVEQETTLVLIQHLLPVGTFSFVCSNVCADFLNHLKCELKCKYGTISFKSNNLDGYSHMDLVDLVLQLFVRGKLFKELLFLILTASVPVLIVTSQVTPRQLSLRFHIVRQTPVIRMEGGVIA